MSFHIAIGKIYRIIAELNVRIGYLPTLTFYSVIGYLPILTFDSAIVL